MSLTTRVTGISLVRVVESFLVDATLYTLIRDIDHTRVSGMEYMYILINHKSALLKFMGPGLLKEIYASLALFSVYILLNRRHTFNKSSK